MDAATSAHGLATTGGLVSSTGVGGLTLGGGIGWLTRYCGLACDNLLAARLVSADGRLRRVDSDTDPDLLWALRGGGGNFGVVTEFEFRLHRVSDVEAGLMLFPIEQAAEVGTAYRTWVRELGDEFTTMLVTLTAPDMRDLPDPVRGRLSVAIAGCHVGDAEASGRDLAAMRALGPDADLFERQSYASAQQMFDADLPPGRRYYFTGAFTAGCPDGMLEVLAQAVGSSPSAGCEIDLHHMGGAARRVPVDGTAFSGRTAEFTANIYACWDEPEADAVHKHWVRATVDALRPFRIDGTYVNFLGDAYTSQDVCDAYGQARHGRLRAVKQRLDPENLFRLNQNIAP